MALGNCLRSLPRRALSLCRATATSPLPLVRPTDLGIGSPGATSSLLGLGSFSGSPGLPHGSGTHAPREGLRFTPGGVPVDLGGLLARSYSSAKKPVIEMTGPGGLMHSVDWTKRPDVFGALGDDGLPVWVDWTRWPAVNAVGNQGRFCGCWAFAVTAAVEGINAVRTHQLVKLSEQQLIDCLFSGRVGELGCRIEEGNPYLACCYIKDNGGIVTEEDYPYVGFQQKPQHIEAPGVTIDNVYEYLDIEESQLKALVAKQPVIVHVGADERFCKYAEPVLDGPNYTYEQLFDPKNSFAHVVVVVGYGSRMGDLYWHIKNSWDKYWGFDGFAFLARETGKPGGAFGITRCVVRPLKWSPNSLVVSVRGERWASDER